MKRIVLLLLTMAIALSFVGCQKYEAQKSTELELKPVATLRFEKKTYEVKYELFRMLFLSAKEVASGGDLSKFEGADSAALLAQAREIALDRIYEIYSVFALCDKLGIDLYSREVDKKVEESITVSIEGGYTETGAPLDGVGTYEKYLESLKLFYANYATQDLMIRYSYGLSAINAYYLGTYDSYGILTEEGALTYTDADVNSYYNSNDTRRILLAFTQMSEERARAICDQAAGLASEDDVSDLLLGKFLGNEDDTRRGLVISKHSWNNSSYAELTEAALALGEGEIAMIAGRSDGGNGYYILYRARKSEDHLSQNRDLVASMYVSAEIGKRYAETKDALEKSASFTDFYNQLSLAAIHMDEEKK